MLGAFAAAGCWASNHDSVWEMIDCRPRWHCISEYQPTDKLKHPLPHNDGCPTQPHSWNHGNETITGSAAQNEPLAVEIPGFSSIDHGRNV